MTQTEAGIALGVVDTTISHFESGHRKPNNVMRQKLRDLFGIPLASWREEVKP